MNILEKIIWKESLTCVSQQNPNKLKDQIEKVCLVHKKINLTGKFISDNEFELTPRWQAINIRSYERELSFLKGKIYVDELNQTKVDFSVRPNSIFVIFFFIFPIVAIFIYFSNTNEDYLLPVLIFGIIVPLICLGIGQISRNIIRDRFIETFNLKKIDSN